jgi:protein-tyrosine phosphatase
MAARVLAALAGHAPAVAAVGHVPAARGRRRRTSEGLARLRRATAVRDRSTATRGQAGTADRALQATAAPVAVADARTTPPPAPGDSLGIASAPNLRDVGGYEAADGRRVRRGLVYRGGQLLALAADEFDRVVALGLRRVFDLRTPVEARRGPTILPRDAERVTLDVLADEDPAGGGRFQALMSDPTAANAAMANGAIDAFYLETYRNFITMPSARRSYGEVCRSLCQPEHRPALVHCTSGKDRTGWAVAALLTLLGVPRAAVVADYLRSNEHTEAQNGRLIDRLVASGLDRPHAVALFSVKAEWLDAAFDEMARRYGNIEGYFSDGLGIEPATRAALKTTFLS